MSDSVRYLILSDIHANLDALQKLPPAEWNAWLDARIKEESGPARSH